MAVNLAPGHRDLGALYRAWTKLRAEQPQRRARNPASDLGVSEARLLAARSTHGEARPLAALPAPLLAGIAELGPVLALTRSDAAVLENVGRYGRPDIGEHTGIVIGENIDLRVFPNGWAFAYAVSDPSDAGVQRSIQIFDGDGAATHKVYIRPQRDCDAYERLVARLASTDAAVPGAASDALQTDRVSDETVDVAAYRQAFASMQDTHDFFMLLHRFKLEREQGLRLAGTEFARPLRPDAHRALFARAATERIPLMIFVASRGMVQISSGTIPQPAIAGPWCDLIDPRFNLHLHEPGIARAWAVRKPTVNGIVTSLELYGPAGALATQIFGERHEGSAERADWRASIAALSTLELP